MKNLVSNCQSFLKIQNNFIRKSHKKKQKCFDNMRSTSIGRADIDVQ